MKTKRFVSTLLALLLICGLPLSAFAEEYDLAQGSVTVNATESGQTVTHGSNAAVPDSAPVITQSDSSTPTDNTVTIKAEDATASVTIQDVNIVKTGGSDGAGKAAVTIDVADNASANVTLDGVNIDVGETGTYDPISGKDISGEAAVQITGNGDVTLELDGENTVQGGNMRAGVEKNTTDSTGKGNLTITDENGTAGSLNATGGDFGSGIGGGLRGSGSNITITGSAEVKAQGGSDGSGIGGGGGGSGSNITISGSAKVTATSVVRGSGIGGGSCGSGSNITITGSAEVTATSVNDGSGIGGGNGGSGSNITISGSAQVEATGGSCGSGIGGGYLSSGSSNITVSQDAQVKAQGGKGVTGVNTYNGTGAAIGEGGKGSTSSPDNIDGEDILVTTDALNEGWIAKYAPSDNMKTAIPGSVTYKDASGMVQTATQNIQLEDALSATCTEAGHEAGFRIDGVLVAVTIPATDHSFTNYVSDNNATYDHDGTKTAKCDHCNVTDTIPDSGSKLVQEEVPQTAPLYRVIDQDGKALACKTERKVGVLTLTVDAEFASLTGSLGGINALKEQGIDTIVFVTNNATSTFALSDLLSQGSTGDSYTLTHDGSAVTFTLGAAKTDISDILAKP